MQRCAIQPDFTSQMQAARPPITPAHDSAETERLAALHRLELMDSSSEPEFDELVQLAASICEAPISIVSLIDDKRQWYISAIGVPQREMPVEQSFCQYTLRINNLLLVEDTREDERFATHPLVTADPAVRFYAGISIQSPDGYPVGSLCVADMTPRQLSALQLKALHLLASQTNAKLELRTQRIALRRALEAERQTTERLTASEARFQTFMDSSPFMSYLKDPEGRFIFYNRVFAEEFSISRQDWIGKTVQEVFPANYASAYRQTDLQALQAGKVYVAVETVQDDQGQLTHWKSYKFPCRDDHQTFLGGVSVNITADLARDAELERYRSQLELVNTQLQRQATTDTLTSLHNRRAVQERLAQDFALARRNHSPLSVLLLDVDNFKLCNDKHGHAGGDRTLCHVASVLRDNIRQTDFVARYGGEEFLLILPETPESEAQELASRLRSALIKSTWPFDPMTVSGGIASLAPDIGTQERLISLADGALYLAKRSGKNRILGQSRPYGTIPGEISNPSSIELPLL